MNKFTDFYEAWWFLYEHPMFQKEYAKNGEIDFTDSYFVSCLDIDVVKVNPETHSIDDDESKNTKVEIWIECGQYDPTCRWHDMDLDCGGDTFEEAIIELANNVLGQYGNTKDRIKPSSWELLEGKKI